MTPGCDSTGLEVGECSVVIVYNNNDTRKQTSSPRVRSLRPGGGLSAHSAQRQASIVAFVRYDVDVVL